MSTTKPRSEVWDNFYVVKKGATLLTTTVHCKYCSWEHLGNASKMQTHLDRKCPGYSKAGGKDTFVTASASSACSSSLSSEVEQVASPEPQAPPKKVAKSGSLLNYLDRPFTQAEQGISKRNLAKDARCSEADLLLKRQASWPFCAPSCHPPGPWVFLWGAG